MELIKSFNDKLKVKDPVELAFESVANPQKDMARIAEYWREAMADNPDMSGDELQDGIGNDLEMLEYSPEDVERMLTQVLKMVLGK